MSQFFDAKFNKVLDSASLRVSLLAAGFAVWFVVGVTVLKFGL